MQGVVMGGIAWACGLGRGDPLERWRGGSMDGIWWLGHGIEGANNVEAVQVCADPPASQATLTAVPGLVALLRRQTERGSGPWSAHTAWRVAL